MDKVLPSDVISYVLSSISDVPTLASAVQTSKRFRAVYKAHPRSIQASVVWNDVGPALPQAMQVALLKDENDCFVTDPEYDYKSLLPPATSIETVPSNWKQCCILSKHARAVHELAKFYSRRYKDRTSSKSMLSEDESLRLTRALYRLWLYVVLFNPRWKIIDEIRLEDEDDDEEDDWEDGNPAPAVSLTVRDTVRLEQREFLEGMLSSRSDMVEFVVVCDFILNDVVPWAETLVINGGAYTVDINYLGQAIHRGPMLGMRYNGPGIAYGMVEDLLVIKGWLNVKREEAPLEGFLDSPPTPDACSKCSGTHSKLYNENNWDMLQGDTHISDFMVTGFEGQLIRNAVERPLITDYFSLGKFDLRAMLLGMFALPSLDDSGEGDSWTKQDWICHMCILAFIKWNKMAWWLEHKRQAGQTIPEDCCRWVFNCGAQVHNMSHAQKLNHFCKPIQDV